jgi:ferredoxin
VPFEGKVADAMKVCGVECAEKCPTGALSVKR